MIEQQAKKEKDVVGLFKKYKPKTYEDVIGLGFKLKQLGSGLYRIGYQIDNLPFVVKLCKESDPTSSDVQHANEEMAALKKLSKSKFKTLHRYLPKVFYFNKSSGITLMPLYKHLAYKESEHFIDFVNKLYWDLGGKDGDLHTSNVAFDNEKEEYVIIDLGFM